MKKAKIGELRNGLSRYLDHVRAGGTVVVFDRDTPVAEIVPIRRTRSRKQADEERLASLERKGLIRRGRGNFAQWLKHHRPLRNPTGVSLVQTILEERESGR